MKRGFKAHAENLATELRFETGTPLLGAFDPFAFFFHVWDTGRKAQ